MGDRMDGARPVRPAICSARGHGGADGAIADRRQQPDTSARRVTSGDTHTAPRQRACACHLNRCADGRAESGNAHRRINRPRRVRRGAAQLRATKGVRLDLDRRDCTGNLAAKRLFRGKPADLRRTGDSDTNLSVPMMLIPRQCQLSLPCWAKVIVSPRSGDLRRTR